MKRLMSLLVATAMLGACEPNYVPQEPHSETRTDKAEAKQIQSDGSETLTIGSNTFRLEAFLWRDFMPMWASEDEAVNGRPMISINWLVEVNSAAIPDNITLVKQFVIYGDLIWETGYEDETRPDQPPYKLEKISRNGPIWDTGILVDVIAEVRDTKTGKSYFLKCENISVLRTD